MKIGRTSAAWTIGLAGVCAGLAPLGLAWHSQPTQPQPARPVNPQPDRPVVPPSRASPNPPDTPANPGTPTNPANPATPNAPTTPAGNRPGPSRMSRPFAFENPADEARFNEGTQRLVRLEQRSEHTNQELTKRLGEIRKMSPERQSAATMELLQQMLKAQAELQQYLVSSRSLWTGDIDAPARATDDPALVNPHQGVPHPPVNQRPATSPRVSPTTGPR
ncbi:MAG: hypothetical protein AABZ53_06480 [Planctomycetota bacterium]|mgnify:CR=1 FL=1